MRLWAAQRASRAQLVLLGWLLQYKHNQGAHSVSQIELVEGTVSQHRTCLSLTSHSTFSLLISNILGKVSAERITLSSHLALSLPPPKRDVQSCQDAAWLAQVRNLPCFLQTACVPEEDFVSRTVSLALTEGRCSLASLQQRARGCQSRVL